MATVAGISHKRMVSGNLDTVFDDIEDSFQYQCAVQAKCDALVTINIKDYRNAQILCTKAFRENIGRC